MIILNRRIIRLYVVRSLVCCLFFLGQAFAGTMGGEPIWKPIVALDLGPAWTNSGQTQTFFLQPDLQNSYQANSGLTPLFDADLFLALEKKIMANMLLDLGVDIAGAGNAKLTGNIWEDANPILNNFTYAYNVYNVHVAFKGKLIGNLERFVAPYLSGSIGVGLNHAYNFTSTPIISQEVPAPFFTSNTEVALTYSLGIGLQKALTTNWQVAIGYEFADWGNNQLSRAPGQSLNEGIYMNHLYTNQLQFSIIYSR